MRVSGGWVATALVACLALVPQRASTGSAGAFASEPAAQIEGAVRSYMEAIDAGDLDRQMRSWSEDTAATSVIMGEIWRGRANIRARSAEYVPVSKRMRNELGAVTVVPLGADAAISVVPYRSVRRDPADEKLRPYELDSMLTLIWRKTRGDWRILHEHASVKVPPPSAQ